MSFNLLPDDLFSSQESEMGEEELNKLVSESEPEGTKRNTTWGMLKFTKWLERRNIVLDLQTVSEERLNEVLRKFYAEVKPEKKGKSLTPSALTGIRAAIQRALRTTPYNRNFNIIADRAFTPANQMFQARCRLYYKQNNPKPQHKAPIEGSDMLLLNKYFADPTSNPVRLQEFVWFTLCLQFGRRGREGWRALQKNHFQIKTDADGKRYVTTEVTESFKNLQGGNKQSEQDYSDCRMYEVAGNILDPVNAFEKYVEKLNPENISLFQKTKKNFELGSSVWYTKEVLGKNTLSNMMKILSRKAGLKREYTNHCIRATTVTTLYQAGVDSQQICSLTKHKNESTLAHYIGSSSDKQKQHASNVLSTSFLSNDAQQMASSSNQYEFEATQNYCSSNQVISCSQVETSRDNTTQQVAYNLNRQLSEMNFNIPTQSQAPSNLESIMSNATFQNCTINFYGYSSTH